MPFPRSKPKVILDESDQEDFQQEIKIKKRVVNSAKLKPRRKFTVNPSFLNEEEEQVEQDGLTLKIKVKSKKDTKPSQQPLSTQAGSSSLNRAGTLLVSYHAEDEAEPPRYTKDYLESLKEGNKLYTHTTNSLNGLMIDDVEEVPMKPEAEKKFLGMKILDDLSQNNQDTVIPDDATIRYLKEKRKTKLGQQKGEFVPLDSDVDFDGSEKPPEETNMESVELFTNELAINVSQSKDKADQRNELINSALYESYISSGEEGIDWENEQINKGILSRRSVVPSIKKPFPRFKVALPIDQQKSQINDLIEKLKLAQLDVTTKLEQVRNEHTIIDSNLKKIQADLSVSGVSSNHS